MKSLKEMLLSAMFVVMASVMLVACGGEGDAPDADNAPDVEVSVEDAAAVEEGSSAVEVVVEEGSSAADEEEEEWFPEEVVGSGSAANN